MPLIRPFYQYLAKPVLFRLDPESVHDSFTSLGQTLGKHTLSRQLTAKFLSHDHPSLQQNIAGLNFNNPIGLSAGFDYDGKLTSIMSSVGFGFESVGTVTNKSYQGNTKPRLTRLPKSRSILVNKGFKSAGVKQVLNDYLVKPDDDFVLGLSIGATNSPKTSEPQTQIPDIINCFTKVVSHPKYQLIDYLELNISCPNVIGAGTLAEAKHLQMVLGQINKLNIKKPLFVKFPIHIKDKEALRLVEIMIKHKVAGVIIGNLYKKRDKKRINASELEKVKDLKGNFSGKPTESLSNHLISLVYKNFGKQITVVGVGGVFSAEDAYHKIRLGASLVQLITGLIYQGPQLVGEINQNLIKLIHRDGYTNISQAVGSSNN